MRTQRLMGNEGRMDSAAAPEEREEKWQRHVMAGLWIFLAALVTACIVLVYAEGSGRLPTGPNHAKDKVPEPAWPVGP